MRTKTAKHFGEAFVGQKRCEILMFLADDNRMALSCVLTDLIAARRSALTHLTKNSNQPSSLIQLMKETDGIILAIHIESKGLHLLDRFWLQKYKMEKEEMKRQ